MDLSAQTVILSQLDEKIQKKTKNVFLIVRLRDPEHDGRMRILKLKDWPTKKDFASVFPTRLHDLMTNIPFGNDKHNQF